MIMLFVHYREFVRLVGQNKALEQLGDQNLELALVDMLTGLSNRRSFLPTVAARGEVEKDRRLLDHGDGKDRHGS